MGEYVMAKIQQVNAFDITFGDLVTHGWFEGETWYGMTRFYRHYSDNHPVLASPPVVHEIILSRENSFQANFATLFSDLLERGEGPSPCSDVVVVKMSEVFQHWLADQQAKEKKPETTTPSVAEVS